ncbi:TPA: hypothetical protein ACGE0M_002767 [Salmonella enterica]
MAFNVFSGGRTEESVAYDLALNLAAKDPEITTPDALIQRIADLLPACRDAANKKHKDESPNPFDMAIKR